MTKDEGPLTITHAAPLLRRGDLTPSELLEQCLARIDVYEPKVKAWVYLDRERARREAEKLTAELKSGLDRGPLHGIPIGIKDIIDVYDMPTGCGSKLWANSYARKDATCVERLRQAGALILGKTVTTPFAYLDPPPTRNPWNLERTPGGSSSGSAAAVACGMCLAALGTQTGGSLIRPASYCGVCSIKPSHRNVSVNGVLPLAPNLDHVGVMANTIRDLAIAYQAIAGPDDKMGVTIPDAVHRIDRRLDPGFKEHSPRYGRLQGQFDTLAEPVIQNAMDRLSRDLSFPDLRYFETYEGYGYPVANLVPPAGFATIHESHRKIMSVQAAEYHGPRLHRQPDDYPPRIRELIEDGLRRSAVEYLQARNEQDSVWGEIDGMIRLPSMYLLTPATTGPAPGAETTGNPAMNSPWSFSGLPTISFPIAWSPDGMPLAVQITGTDGGEGGLFEAAAWAERLTRFERRPIPL